MSTGIPLFNNNCPIRERTGDGISVGRCWCWCVGGCCPRHGNVQAELDHYKRTGKCSEDPRRKKTP